MMYPATPPIRLPQAPRPHLAKAGAGIRRQVLHLLLLCALSLIAIDPSVGAEPRQPVRIGVLYWSMNIPGQVAMRKGLEAEMERLNEQRQTRGEAPLELLVRVAGDGPQGVERQIRQMHELLARRPDALIVQPTDNAALAEALVEANRQQIPVVAYDQYIAGGKLSAYITSDNRQAGYLGGEYLAAQFPNQHSIRLVLVEYPRVSSTVERLDGFLDALRDHRQAYRIVNSYEAVEPIGGRAAGLAILRDYPEPGSIDALFTVNDGGGLGVVEVLAEAGRTEILHVTVDGDPQSVENIRQQRLTRIDSAQFCGPMGAEALRATLAVLAGETRDEPILIPTFPITLETLARYTGWLGPIPPSFVKPWQALEPVWRGRTASQTP